MNKENLISQGTVQKMKSFEQIWENATIADDFIFGMVMENPEICKEFLEALFGYPIERIEYPILQKVMKTGLDSKGVRLDVYVRDGLGTVYNIEMQATTEQHIEKRARYYSSMIDQDLIKVGEPYSELRKSYVIFVCKNDVFGANIPIYTVRNTCIEKPEIIYNDDVTKIFLNAKAYSEQVVNGSLKSFLQYIVDGTISGSFVKKVDKEVNRLKQSSEIRRFYMEAWMREAVMRKQALEEGMEKGRIDLLRSQIKAKLQKGKSLEQIADELEETVENIKPMYDEIVSAEMAEAER